MIQNITGINGMQRQMMDPSQYYGNSYATQVMNSDSDFMGLSPINGVSGGNGIFGGGMMGGMMPGMMGGMNGYGPGSECMNMSQIDYMKYQERMEDYQIDKQVRQKHKLANSEFSATAAEDVITRQIGVLQRKIKNNEQDSVFPEYNKLVKAVEEKLKEGGYVGEHTSKDQIKAHAEKLYFEATGKSVTDDLAANGDSGFVHGMKQGVGGFGWMLTNKKNYEDNISDITGEDKSGTSTAWQKVGQFTSVLLTGAFALLALKGGKAVSARP